MENVVFTQLSIPEFRKIIQQELEQFHKLNLPEQEQPTTRKIMSLPEVCEYTGLSRQTIYKKTSRAEIPHAKRGKKLFFDREKVDAWLLENQVATQAEIKDRTNAYLSKKRNKRRI